MADQVRSLFTGGDNPLRAALVDLASCLGRRVGWALVGGLAVGLRARPRGTQDVDICVLSEGDLAEAAALTSAKFSHARPHALTHRQTGVEVELLTPEFLKLDRAFIARIIATACVEDLGGTSVPVASRAGLVAAKLQRLSDYDRGDIKEIIRSGGPVDLSGFDLTDAQLAAYEEISAEARKADRLRDE